MRIISKFGDYYDSALGFGIDTTCIYVRKKEKIQVPKELKDSIYSSGRYNRYTTPVGNYSYEYRSIFIGFCGKVYTALVVKKIHPKKDDIDSNWDKDVIYNIDDFVKFFTTEKHGYLFDVTKNRRYKYIEDEKIRVKEFFELHKVTDKHIDLFHELNIPIFVIGGNILDSVELLKDGSKFDHNGRIMMVNYPLKDYKFYKIFDSYTAFQEINMFVSGVLKRSEPVTTDVSEACKVSQKGFDSWSFRKKPEPCPNYTPKLRKKDKCCDK